MRPTRHAPPQLIFREWRSDRVVLEKAVVAQDDQIAGRIGRFIDTVLLRGIAGGRKVHARAIFVGADFFADPLLDPTDSISDRAAFFGRAVVFFDFFENRFDFFDISVGETEFRLHFAAVAVTNRDAVFNRLSDFKILKMAFDRPQALMRAASHTKA